MAKITREEQLKESLKRILVCGKLYRMALEELRISDLAKEWAQTAKQNGNKSFHDLRIPAANAIRAVDSMLIEMRKTMGPETIRAILENLNGEGLQEMSILIEQTADLKHTTIAEINNQIKEAGKTKQ